MSQSDREVGYFTHIFTNLYILPPTRTKYTPAAKPDTSSRICPPSEGVPAEQAGEDKTVLPNTSYTNKELDWLRRCLRRSSLHFVSFRMTNFFLSLLRRDVAKRQRGRLFLPRPSGEGRGEGRLF